MAYALRVMWCLCAYVFAFLFLFLGVAEHAGHASGGAKSIVGMFIFGGEEGQGALTSVLWPGDRNPSRFYRNSNHEYGTALILFSLSRTTTTKKDPCVRRSSLTPLSACNVPLVEHSRCLAGLPLALGILNR